MDNISSNFDDINFYFDEIDDIFENSNSDENINNIKYEFDITDIKNKDVLEDHIITKYKNNTLLGEYTQKELFKVNELVGVRDKEQKWYLGKILHIFIDKGYPYPWYYIQFEGMGNLQNEWIGNKDNIRKLSYKHWPYKHISDKDELFRFKINEIVIIKRNSIYHISRILHCYLITKTNINIYLVHFEGYDLNSKQSFKWVKESEINKYFSKKAKYYREIDIKNI